MGQTPRFPCYSFRIAGPLAQTVEHLPFKQGVAGSNPARLIKSSQFLATSYKNASVHHSGRK
jgi:hypothetical protein